MPHTESRNRFFGFLAIPEDAGQWRALPRADSRNALYLTLVPQILYARCDPALVSDPSVCLELSWLIGVHHTP